MTASISLGMALVTGRNLVPCPAAGMTAFFTLFIGISPLKVFYLYNIRSVRFLQCPTQIPHCARSFSEEIRPIRPFRAR